MKIASDTIRTLLKWMRAWRTLVTQQATTAFLGTPLLALTTNVPLNFIVFE